MARGVGGMGWSFGVRPQNQTVKGQPTTDNAGGIMTQHKISCLAAVLVSHYVYVRRNQWLYR